MGHQTLFRNDRRSHTHQSASLAVATNLYEAFDRGDIAGVLALLHPAVEWREAEGNPYRPDGSPWIGPQDILTEYFARLGGDWDDFGLHGLVLTETAQGVLTEGRYYGTFKATGRSVDMQVAHVLRIQDGLLTHFQQYIDTATYRWAMGVASPHGEGDA